MDDLSALSVALPTVPLLSASKPEVLAHGRPSPIDELEGGVAEPLAISGKLRSQTTVNVGSIELVSFPGTSSSPPPLVPPPSSCPPSVLFPAENPTLPIEILERILSYTFLPPTRTHPYSDPHHLRGTTHVLLVSRAFRQLSLPFFHHSLTITRPSDFTTFFHSTDGLFAGPEGLNKWGLVKELALLTGVQPPLVADHPTEPGDPWVVPLSFPSSTHSVNLACIIDRRPIPPSPSAAPSTFVTSSGRSILLAPSDPQIADLVATARIHPFIRAQCLNILHAEYADDAELDGVPISPEGFTAWVAATYGEDESLDEVVEQMIDPHIELQIEAAREAALAGLFQCARPKRLVLPNDPYTHEPLLGALVEEAKVLELWCPPSGSGGSGRGGGEEKGQEVEVVLETVANMIYNIGGDEVRLVGYGQELLRALRKALERPVGDEAEEAAKLRWSWEDRDGALVTVEVSSLVSFAELKGRCEGESAMVADMCF